MVWVACLKQMPQDAAATGIAPTGTGPTGTAPTGTGPTGTGPWALRPQVEPGGAAPLVQERTGCYCESVAQSGRGIAELGIAWKQPQRMLSLHSDPSLAVAEAVDEQGVGEIGGEEAGKAS